MKRILAVVALLLVGCAGAPCMDDPCPGAASVEHTKIHTQLGYNPAIRCWPADGRPPVTLPEPHDEESCEQTRNDWLRYADRK